MVNATGCGRHGRRGTVPAAADGVPCNGVDGAVGLRTARRSIFWRGGKGAGAVVPYGAVPVELLMLIFGLCRRDVPVQLAVQ
jgi:hypothetical protein